MKFLKAFVQMKFLKAFVQMPFVKMPLAQNDRWISLFCEWKEYEENVNENKWH